MQAPRTSRASLVKGRAQANAMAQQALIAHWQSIVKSLDNYLKIMKANFVSSKFSIIHIIFIASTRAVLYPVLTGTSILSPQSLHADILVY